ncbi:XRE family transcriptional regulator [Burkholderia pseudomallei]|uniref:helix-turn-helix domain-containing protein n=1 Tax=Burkholderia pseudomallei TaxID=28450 RepID=UPI0015608933|nr:helix-turn-helix transcriptional regulator [Burkholderia pseudomallei]NRE34368.1 XRE family transcriptional regulator [Burkholderia pseudomallei]
MSPFSERLRALRLRYGIRQKDLAVAMALEQSYVSALELGTKGPPSPAIVDRLSACLRLTEDEHASLHDALLLSQRHFTIPHTASADVYRLCSELWHDLDRLTDAQVRVIRDVIAMRSGMSQKVERPIVGRVVRRGKEDAKM